jgi:hypothetical protein
MQIRKSRECEPRMLTLTLSARAVHRRTPLQHATVSMCSSPLVGTCLHAPAQERHGLQQTPGQSCPREQSPCETQCHASLASDLHYWWGLALMHTHAYMHACTCAFTSPRTPSSCPYPRAGAPKAATTSLFEALVRCAHRLCVCSV